MHSAVLYFGACGDEINELGCSVTKAIAISFVKIPSLNLRIRQRRSYHPETRQESLLSKIYFMGEL